MTNNLVDRGGDLVSHEEFESILSFENLNNAAWDKSTCDSMPAAGKGCQSITAANDGDDKVHIVMPEKNKLRSENSTPPLSFLEKWLLDESAAGQVEEMMEMSPMFWLINKIIMHALDSDIWSFKKKKRKKSVLSFTRVYLV